MKHRVLQGEVVVKTSQVEVLGHQHVWDEGEVGLHGQDVRSQCEGDVSEEVWQGGSGGGGFCCGWDGGGEPWRTLWLSWVAAGRLRRSRCYWNHTVSQLLLHFLSVFKQLDEVEDWMRAEPRQRTTPDVNKEKTQTVPPLPQFVLWTQTHLWQLHDDVG